MTEQELKKEIELIFEKYEEDFDLEEISEDFYNVIQREKKEGKKEAIEEEIKFLENINGTNVGHKEFTFKEQEPRLKFLKQEISKEKT